jgi:pimeloyl-ACP methyl ester carboxylesterase
VTATASRSRTPRPVPVARLSDATLPPVDPSIPPWPADKVRVAGADLLVRRTPGPPGGGEPALYVHGLGGASTNWTDYAGLLATRLDGEALDLPGFGDSGPAPVGYGPADHARIVIAYLDQRSDRRGGRPVHLVGNSLGGVVTVLVAALRPDLVRTLTLVSPAMPWLRPRRGSDLAVPMLLLPGVGTYAQRRLDTLPAQRRAAGVIDLCFAHPERVPLNRRAEAEAEIERRTDLPWAGDAFTRSLRGLARSYFAGGAWSLWARARAITAPTLVVWGTEDRLVPVTLAPRTAAEIPDSRLLVVPEVGHVAQLESPETTARATLALIEDTA